MAMTVFLVLNGLSAVFLLYVLAKFWNEGRRSRRTRRRYTLDFGARDWNNEIVETHALVGDSAGRRAVIPFPPQRETLQERPSRGAA